MSDTVGSSSVVPPTSESPIDANETQSLVDISDLVERNVFSAEDEKTIVSGEIVNGVLPMPKLRVLKDRSELDVLLQELGASKTNARQKPRNYFENTHVEDVALLNTFTQSFLPSLAPAELRFKEESPGSVLLHYPVRFVIADENGRYLDEDDSHHVEDGLGYPAFFSRKGLSIRNLEMRGRISLTTYPSNVSPSILAKINTMYDSSTARAFQNCLQLRSEEDAIWVVRNRAKSAAVGDNHLALLIRAFMYYFDSLHLVHSNTSAKRFGQKLSGYAYNVQKETGWITSVSQNAQEIVNCLGMPTDYAEFWTYCCLPMNECFVAFETKSREVYSSPFALFHSSLQTKMCVIMDTSITSNMHRIPSWFRNPDVILSYIEMYTRKFSLQQQANDAYSIAQVIPIVRSLNLPFAIPEPIHSCDWFEGQIGLLDANLITTSLLNSNRISILAALHSAPMVLTATLYDVQCTLMKDRPQFAVAETDVRLADSLLGRLISAPGLVPAFLFQTCLGLNHTLVAMIGWDRMLVPIHSLLPKVYSKCEHPLHLLLLQRISGSGSVRANMPINEPKHWPTSVMNSTLDTAFNSFMALKRVGLLSPRKSQISYSDLCQGVLPLMTDETRCSITLDPWLGARIRYLTDSKVTIQFIQTYREEHNLPWTIATPEIHILLDQWDASLNPSHWDQSRPVDISTVQDYTTATTLDESAVVPE